MGPCQAECGLPWQHLLNTEGMQLRMQPLPLASSLQRMLQLLFEHLVFSRQLRSTCCSISCTHQCILLLCATTICCCWACRAATLPAAQQLSCWVLCHAAVQQACAGHAAPAQQHAQL